MVADALQLGYVEGMANAESIDLLVSTEEEVEVDAETLAAIDEGLKAADEGRVVPAEAVPNLISQWISRFSTQNPH